MNKIFVHNDETNACFTGNRLKISIDHVTITAELEVAGYVMGN